MLAGTMNLGESESSSDRSLQDISRNGQSRSDGKMVLRPLLPSENEANKIPYQGIEGRVACAVSCGGYFQMVYGLRSGMGGMLGRIILDEAL